MSPPSPFMSAACEWLPPTCWLWLPPVLAHSSVSCLHLITDMPCSSLPRPCNCRPSDQMGDPPADGPLPSPPSRPPPHLPRGGRPPPALLSPGEQSTPHPHLAAVRCGCRCSLVQACAKHSCCPACQGSARLHLPLGCWGQGSISCCWSVGLAASSGSIWHAGRCEVGLRCHPSLL